jgi:GNAT superfamily N-acetyltransferase
MSFSIHDRFTLRPAVLDDIPAVLGLLHLNSQKLIGEADDDADEIRTTWTAPDFDLSADTRLAFEAAGALAGYAIVHLDRPMSSMLDVYVRPDRWLDDADLADWLMSWAIERARAGIARSPEGMRVAVSAWTDSRDADCIALLERHGMTPYRYSQQMRITLSEPPQPPEPIAGITIRPANDGDDWRAVLDVIVDAWRDHRGYIERDFEERFVSFQHDWQEGYVPGAWLLALEGERIVGVSLCTPTHAGYAHIGTVHTLAVRREARRRGIALALLRASFVALHAMGDTMVNLWVDANSLTGATRVYERAGMSVFTRYTAYELELRPGCDPTVRAAAHSAEA